MEALSRVTDDELINLIQDDVILDALDLGEELECDYQIERGTYTSSPGPSESSSDGTAEYSPRVVQGPRVLQGSTSRSHITIETSRRKSKNRKQDPVSEDDEDPEAKRQKRLVRNRASAALSRQRKKGYQEELEQKVAFLVAQNEKMSKEMSSLRGTFTRLQSENEFLRQQLTASKQQEPIQLSILDEQPPFTSSTQTQAHSSSDDAQHLQQKQAQPPYDLKSAVLTGSPYDSPQLESPRLSLFSQMQCLIIFLHILCLVAADAKQQPSALNGCTKPTTCAKPISIPPPVGLPIASPPIRTYLVAAAT